jgi:hypothetical protein
MLKISLFVSARSTSGNLTMVCAMSSKNIANCFFFVMLSLSDLSCDAMNFLNVAHKSEVSWLAATASVGNLALTHASGSSKQDFFFLFETVEEVDSDADGACDSEAISSSSSYHHCAFQALPPEVQRSYEF